MRAIDRLRRPGPALAASLMAAALVTGGPACSSSRRSAGPTATSQPTSAPTVTTFATAAGTPTVTSIPTASPTATFGHLYVTDYNAATVSVLALGSLATVATIAVGVQPTGLAF